MFIYRLNYRISWYININLGFQYLSVHSDNCHILNTNIYDEVYIVN